MRDQNSPQEVRGDVCSILGESNVNMWHRRLNHKNIKALIAAYRLRKLNIPVERSVLNKVFKGHSCSACGRGRPRRRVDLRHRDLDEDYPGIPKPFERGHMIVSDSH